jgi:hypothetical protein
MGRVLVGPVSQLSGQFFLDVDGVGWTDRHASAAVYAFGGMDVQHRSFRIASLVLFGMNAIDRARGNTLVVLRASIHYYVCHFVLLGEEIGKSILAGFGQDAPAGVL